MKYTIKTFGKPCHYQFSNIKEIEVNDIEFGEMDYYELEETFLLDKCSVENMKISLDDEIKFEIYNSNSKILDLNIRFPHFLKAYENDLRKEISNKLQRGKIELNVNSEIGANTDVVSINKEIIANYIQQLKQLNDINSDEKDYLKMAMRLPNAYSSKSIELNNTETVSYTHLTLPTSDLV